jgi:hypothetical protein
MRTPLKHRLYYKCYEGVLYAFNLIRIVTNVWQMWLGGGNKSKSGYE